MTEEYILFMYGVCRPVCGTLSVYLNMAHVPHQTSKYKHNEISRARHWWAIHLSSMYGGTVPRVPVRLVLNVQEEINVKIQKILSVCVQLTLHQCLPLRNSPPSVHVCVMKNLCLATTVKYFFVSWKLKHEFEFVQTMPTIWKVGYYESLWNSVQGSAAPICVE
jgi:hypothetical protein